MKRIALLSLLLVLLTGCQQFREWWTGGGFEATRETLRASSEVLSLVPGFGPAAAAVITLIVQGLALTSPAEDDE